jgi:hypothetical protein
LETAGGSLVEEALERLRVELDDYYGALFEVQQGTKEFVPEPPEALLYFKMCKEMRIPLVAGGVMDQPHIWLMEYAICENKSVFYENQNRASQEVPSVNDKFAQDRQGLPRLME